jgi:hypothetical protein
MMRLIHLKYFQDVYCPKKCQSFLEMKTYFSKCIPHREDTLIFTLLSPKVPNVIQVVKFRLTLTKDSFFLIWQKRNIVPKGLFDHKYNASTLVLFKL